MAHSYTMRSLAAALIAAHISSALSLSNATRYFIDTASGGVCLDGSAPVYYLYEGKETRKFVIFQKGGGWCSSDSDCAARANSVLGSSKTYPEYVDLDVDPDATGFGSLSSSPTINPMWWNWTKVFMPYCDGGSQTGNLDGGVKVGSQTIYYRGARILQQMAKSLMAQLQLASATDVLVTGGSAGGLSTYLHCDFWRDVSPRATVVAMPDSGFFLDYNRAPGKTPSYHDDLTWVATAMNATEGLPAACRAANPTNVSRCIFAEHVIPTLKTPLFALNSEYDAYQVADILHAPANDTTAINAYGDLFVQTVQNTLLLPSGPQHAIFLDSCYHHTRDWQDITIDGQTQPQAFATWYGSLGQPNAKRLWLQNQTYPCPACCTNGG
jgi:hypothetical protein